jgi:hypothetical protein
MVATIDWALPKNDYDVMANFRRFYEAYNNILMWAVAGGLAVGGLVSSRF